MFADLKKMIQHPAPAGAGYVHTLSAHARAALQFDLGRLLGKVVRADEFPYLVQLGETTQSNFSRIHIPASAAPKLAREIEAVRHKLPARSPLLGLAESARRCHGRELVVASNEANAEMSVAKPGAAAQARNKTATAMLSAGEQSRILKTAAAKVDVSFVSTAELGEPALAAYFKYCLGRGEYDKVIGDLRSRAGSEPRVWVAGACWSPRCGYPVIPSIRPRLRSSISGWRTIIPRH